jgi:hypothetical protein
MVSALLILVVAFLALFLAYSLLRGGYAELRNERDWEENKHAIDVQIFRILLDRKQEAELRNLLSPNQFATFQRRRTRLALRMLRLVDENTGMLMALGRLARMKGDPALTLKIDELITTAFQLRLNLLLARLCLYIKWLFPSRMVSLPAFDVPYQHLLDSLHASSGAVA